MTVFTVASLRSFATAHNGGRRCCCWPDGQSAHRSSHGRESQVSPTTTRDFQSFLSSLVSSKSELKKRIKQREVEEKKAAKNAANPLAQAQTAKKTSAEEDEAELTPNVSS